MTKEKDEQLDKALTEIDVLEDSDKDVLRIDSETYRLEKVDFKLVEDYREAFDLEMIEERYTSYLLKYDYIVGDIGYDKLRLRGFYDDHRKGVPLDMKISYLEDYLVEYCNFGCPYFVFERAEKKKNDPESYFKRKKKSKRKNRKNKKNQKNKKQSNNKSHNKQHKNKKQQNNKNQQKNKKSKDFHVKKKDDSKKNQQKKTNQQKKSSQPKKKESNKQFEIRKKKGE